MPQSSHGKTMGQTGRAVIYLRVSTEEQVENYSLETQENICRKEAERRGLTVFDIFREEGRSAKTIKGRPVLIEMLEFCRKHKREIDTIIVYRLDRISRQTADYLAIRKKLTECEITLVSATEPTGETPTEKFVETMLAGFAQMDNDVRSERSRNGMKARFMAGLYNGRTPLGYLNQDGYASIDPKTFDKMKAAWDMMATGTTTLRAMADILNAQGVRERRAGGKEYLLRSQSLSRIFSNKFYAGKVVSKRYGMEVQGQHTAMITEEQFYLVQAVLQGRNKLFQTVSQTRRNKDNPDFRMRRIAKCSGCGQSFTGGWSKGRHARYAYYFCPKRCGAGPSVPLDTLEEATTLHLTDVSPSTKTVNLFVATLRKEYCERIGNLQNRRSKADGDIKKVYELRQALIEKNLSGIYSDEIFKEQNALLEEKLKVIHVAKNDAVIEKYNLEAITLFIKQKLGNLSDTYKNSDLAQTRALLGSIYPSGMPWGYPGYSNPEFSPFYRLIVDAGQGNAPIGGRQTFFVEPNSARTG